MSNVYSLDDEKGIKICLRQHRPDGNYFLITVSLQTGNIINIERLSKLPEHWTQEYIDKLFSNGELFNSKIFDKDGNLL